MALDVLQSILEAEKSAAEVMAAAQRDAVDIIKEAENAARLRDKTRPDADGGDIAEGRDGAMAERANIGLGAIILQIGEIEKRQRLGGGLTQIMVIHNSKPPPAIIVFRMAARRFPPKGAISFVCSWLMVAFGMPAP